MLNQQTPRELGYYFPAEFAPHDAMWLSWPHKEESWPGKIESIYPVYSEFIRYVAMSELVNINVTDDAMRLRAIEFLQRANADLSRINFFLFPTNDAWCRDHGPAFLIHSDPSKGKVIVKWNYNAWGDKYPPYDLDNQIPLRIASHYQIPVFKPGIVMEGGSVEFNGKGTVMTTTACLLNKNRNPHLNQSEIEKFLLDYYGMNQCIWLNDGIVGDDTDGHIDDITRFINEDTVVSVVEESKSDENYHLLQENLKLLQKAKLQNGKSINVVELPMPSPVIYNDQRLPASYANFYISNSHVIVPTFRDKNDDNALRVLQSCFKERTIIGLDSTDIIWGLGSFHCLSQQEPAIHR